MAGRARSHKSLRSTSGRVELRVMRDNAANARTACSPEPTALAAALARPADSRTETRDARGRLSEAVPSSTPTCRLRTAPAPRSESASATVAACPLRRGAYASVEPPMSEDSRQCTTTLTTDASGGSWPGRGALISSSHTAPPSPRTTMASATPPLPRRCDLCPGPGRGGAAIPADASYVTASSASRLPYAPQALDAPTITSSAATSPFPRVKLSGGAASSPSTASTSAPPSQERTSGLSWWFLPGAL
mmetsp:Transcript_38929/g.123766  ORF Transcript_38929/g.123766 Transcript_38929/m.123766 type:complete len:248 (-) Transcript_38929:747-1490(-)